MADLPWLAVAPTSLAYSGSMAATWPEPRVARCQSSTNARNSTSDTTVARSVSDAVTTPPLDYARNIPKGEGRRAVPAGQWRRAARTMPGPTLAFRDVAKGRDRPFTPPA